MNNSEKRKPNSDWKNDDYPNIKDEDDKFFSLDFSSTSEESDSTENTETSNNDDDDEYSECNVNLEFEENIDNNDEWYKNTIPIRNFKFDDRIYDKKINIDDNSNPRHIFNKFFTQNIIETIVNGINNYGKHLNENNHQSNGRKKRSKYEFHETNEEELMKFFGLCLLQTQNKSPTIDHLFSNNALYYCPIFLHTMSKRRFEQLLRCLNGHYTNTNEEINHIDKKLNEIDLILNPILNNFQTVLSPKKEICLNKPFSLRKGQLLNFHQQNIEKKFKRDDIKFYELTTTDGYVLNVEIHLTKRNAPKKSSKINDFVLLLIKPYMNKGYHLFMNEFYTNIELCKELLNNYKIHSTGILYSNSKKDIPKELFLEKLKRGDHIWRRKDEIYISKWQDKHEIFSLTTSYHPQLIKVLNKLEQKKMKPIDVDIYNQHMTLNTNKFNERLNYYSSPKQLKKWYKQIIFYVLDLCVWNSFYIYQQHQKTINFLQFRDLIIKSLIQLSSDLIINKNPILTSSQTESSSFNDIPSNQHFMERIPSSSSNGKFAHLRCRQCYRNKIRRETTYRCKTCPEKPPLCILCFESYHLQKFELIVV